MQQRRKQILLWVLLVIFLCSLFVMWYFALRNLVVKGGFAGITGWLVWGACYVWVRLPLLWARIKHETAKGSELMMIMRLWCLFFGSIFNLVANIVAIYLIVANFVAGKLTWSNWDYACFAVGIIGVLLYAIGKVEGWPQAARLFLLVVFTRVFQQSTIAFSPQLEMIPFWTLFGLFGVANQQAGVSYLELGEAKFSREEAQLLFLADGLNAGSAILPLARWLVVH